MSTVIFHKSRSYLEIPCACIVTLIEDPQILGATVINLVATATWCPEFVHPCSVMLVLPFCVEGSKL